MAYNPSMYAPYNYQPQQQYIPPQPVSQQPVNGLVSVTGMDGAKAYQLPPNSSAALFDASSDVFYVKTTDGAGFPTIKTFAFQQVEDSQQAPDADLKSELESIKADVAYLKSKLAEGEQDAQ